MIVLITLAYPAVWDGWERRGPTGLSKYDLTSRCKTKFLGAATGAGEGSGGDTNLGSRTVSTVGDGLEVVSTLGGETDGDAVVVAVRIVTSLAKAVLLSLPC